MARNSKKQSNVETKVEEVVVETATEPSDSFLAAIVQNLQESVENAEKQEAKAKTEPTPKVEKNQGVGMFVRKLIAQGMSNKDILKEVHEAYGNTQTTYACVAWYRNKMKKAQQVQKTTSAVETVNKFLNTEQAPAETPVVEAGQEVKSA